MSGQPVPERGAVRQQHLLLRARLHGVTVPHRDPGVRQCALSERREVPGPHRRLQMPVPARVHRQELRDAPGPARGHHHPRHPRPLLGPHVPQQRHVRQRERHGLPLPLLGGFCWRAVSGLRGRADHHPQSGPSVMPSQLFRRRLQRVLPGDQRLRRRSLLLRPAIGVQGLLQRLGRSGLHRERGCAGQGPGVSPGGALS